VSYGANGKFTAPKAFTGGVACNNGTFGDPAPGVRKWCETRPTSTPTPQPGYTFCSWEDTQCSFSGTLQVIYGANGKFTAPKAFTGSVACNNATFGDPAPGVRKWCETKPGTTLMSVQSPTAAPAATTAAPKNATSPEVSGVSVVGTAAKASAGTWQNSPTSFVYIWSRCDATGHNCTSIPGATAAVYNLVAADRGRTLVATVIATNASGSAFASSAPTAVVKKSTRKAT
jgi:hypothetical protein